MPKAKNIATVADLTEKFSRAKGVVVTDYQGLTHKQMETLHGAVKKAGAEYVVVKNSLLNIASQKKVSSTGPTAVLLSYEDEFAPLRELVKFIKTNSKPLIKNSILGDTTYDAAETSRIANLPSKEGLIAQLMFTLNANTQKLAYLLTQIHLTEVKHNV